MKEFEKWWKKDSWEGDWDYEEYAKRGWRAALEWVLGTLCIDPGSEEIIKQELGDT